MVASASKSLGDVRYVYPGKDNYKDGCIAVLLDMIVSRAV